MQITTTVRYCTRPRRTIIKKTSVGEHVKKLGPSYTAGDSVEGGTDEPSLNGQTQSCQLTQQFYSDVFLWPGWIAMSA